MTTMVQKISGGLLAAALATTGLIGVAATANAEHQSSARAGASSKTDFNPTIEKVESNKLLLRAENINKSNTIKLMVDKNGTWRVLETWDFSNSRDRKFTEVVEVGFVGKNPDAKYTLRVIDRNRNGRVVQVQDSNEGKKANNPGADEPTPEEPNTDDDGGLGLPDLPLP